MALAACLFAVAYTQPPVPLSSRSAVVRSSAVQMAGAPPGTSGSYLSFDQDGVFSGNPNKGKKPPLKVLTRLESLGVLTSLAETGLLSSAEASGLFSKLEAAGAFSSIEKLLPLADKLNVFSTLESLLLVDSSALLLGAVALLVGEVGLITVLPDDVPALVAVQVVTGFAAGLGATTLLGAAALFGTLQSKN
eukprot:CAMPEP_0119070032 /NCGR_PEP_ID=MMETSP1178-20130426/33363_1 /TAXON_ID=33656 /ORGANISM="unid sp, Strain CCMP2000" /LENGTH=191 /DNA_ID=CAMNT_0007051841 /DNA_START=34 /DNA_END=609 /DNA_ORIENTATION=-